MPEKGRYHEPRHAPLQKLKIVLPHVILVVGTLLYTLLGASIFYLIERPNEVWKKERETQAVRALQVRALRTGE